MSVICDVTLVIVFFVVAEVHHTRGSVCFGLKAEETLVFHKTTRVTLSSINMIKSAPSWPSPPVCASLKQSANYWRLEAENLRTFPIAFHEPAVS